ncbi:MAG: hypothetical protein SFV15_16175 [Polyangiaceae bacterium]|nr:hypothetical protein [Polyangiaceae bacterium]
MQPNRLLPAAPSSRYVSRETMSVGQQRARCAFLTLLLCGGCGGEANGRLEVGSVVAPLYAGVEVRYKAVAHGEACDAPGEGEVSGPASRGPGLDRLDYVFAFSRDYLELPAGRYGICATVYDTRGQLEARCPTSAIEVKVTANVTSTAYIGIVCDPVLDEKTGHAYTVTPLVDSFGEASTVAQQMGGHLVYIDDMDENMMLGNHFSRRKWMGFWDPDGDRTFEWLDGKARSFSNFCAGEPNTQAGEYYAEWGMGYADTSYCWNNEAYGPRQGIVEFE